MLAQLAESAPVVAVTTGCSANPQSGERKFNRTGIGAAISAVAGGCYVVVLGECITR